MQYTRFVCIDTQYNFVFFLVSELLTFDRLIIVLLRILSCFKIVLQIFAIVVLR